MSAVAATRNLISIDEALGLVLERVERLPAEALPYDAALGRVLAEDARARVDLPPFDSSAMDGFALRSADTPGRLPVAHRIAAGSPASRALEAGEAMGIATGGAVPAGADAVIPFEYVVENDNTIEIEQAVEVGANLRPAGGDVRAGETVVEAGVLVTSGGVSVGPHDLVRSILAELGVEEVFWGVSVKPGKPISFGVAGSRLVFGLPGNPVSVLVGFELFVRPALLALQGSADPGPAFRGGTLARACRRNPHRDELVRAVARPGEAAVELEPVSGQESHMIARAA